MWGGGGLRYAANFPDVKDFARRILLINLANELNFFASFNSLVFFFNLNGIHIPLKIYLMGSRIPHIC